MTCGRGRECNTRIKLKVSKKTSSGSCLHENIAGLFFPQAGIRNTASLTFFTILISVAEHEEAGELVARNEEEDEPKEGRAETKKSMLILETIYIYSRRTDWICRTLSLRQWSLDC